METEKQKGVAGAIEAVAQIAKKLGGEQPGETSTPATAAKKETEAKKEEAKRLAKRLASPSERIKVEAELQKIQPETVGLQEAKTRLSTALSQGNRVEWLVKSSEQFQANPDAALFAAKIAKADPELQNDPYYLLSEGTKFFWSTKLEDLTPEARSEADSVMRSIRNRISELQQTNTEFQKDIPSNVVPEELIPEARTGMTVAPGAPDPVDELYPSSGTDPIITNAELAQKVKDIQVELQVTSSSSLGIHDTDIPSTIKAIGRGVAEGKWPRDQAIEAVNRLERVISRARERQEVLEGRGIIRWDEVIGQMAPEVAALHTGGPQFRFSRLSQEDANLIKRGEEQEREWFYQFVEEIFAQGKEERRPALPEEYKWNDFTEYLKWKYGEHDALRYMEEYQKHWDDRGRFDHATKTLLYKPGDIKSRIGAFRLITGSDLDYLTQNFQFANYATTLYEEVAIDTMSDKLVAHKAAIKWLKDTPEEINPLDKEHKLPRWKLYKKLVDENAKSHQKDAQGNDIPGTSGLNTDQQALMYEIRQKLDLVGEGVMLWDSDIQSYTEAHLEWQRMQTRYDFLESKQTKGEALSQAEIYELRELPDQMRRKQELYIQRELEPESGEEKSPWQDISREHLNLYRGLSPLDIEVRKRLLTYIKLKGLPEPPEYKVRLAIWAARQHAVASGHIIDIGARMAIAPRESLELNFDENLITDYLGYAGKQVMKSPAFEDVQRYYNPELFAYRFSMGGPMGERARGILARNLLGNKIDIKSKPQWKETANISDPEIRLYRAYARYAEQELGIGFTELLRKGFFKGGGQFDASNWRPEMGIWDEVRDNFLKLKKAGKLPEGAALDNLALGIQLLITDNPEDKLRVFDKMMRRKPSKFLQVAADIKMGLLKTPGREIDPSGQEWKMFERALSLAEMQLWDDPELRVSHIDLTNREDFRKIMTPIFKELKIVEENQIPGKIEIYADILEGLRSKLTEVGKEDKKTILERWAEHKFPMTLMLSDFDWKDSNFFKLGSIAMDRRGRDNEMMAGARDIFIDLTSKPEFLSPINYQDTLKKIKEFRDTMNGYTDTDSAEAATKEMMRVFLDSNRMRDNARLFAWAPFGVSLLRFGAELDTRGIGGLTFLNKLTGGKWEKWWIKTPVGKKWKSWWERMPNFLADQLSYSVRFTGGDGNAWGEAKIAKIIADADSMGIFNKNRHFVQDLRKEFHATPEWTILQAIRRYWWILPLVTFLLATEESVTEEKKRGGH